MAAADFSGSCARALEGIERQKHGARVRGVREGGAREAGEIHGVRDARAPASAVSTTCAIDGIGARQRGPARQLRDDDQVAGVELRDEADRRLAELVEAEGDDAPHRRPA